MIKTIIQRPVLASVVSILLVMLGIIGLQNLPLTQFPEIAPPQVSVQAFYPGGNAEAVTRTVIVPLEEAINGVENMTYIQSNASNDGGASINVSFKLGTNPDLAAVNVQNRVQAALSLLPPEVIRAGIQTVKQNNSFIMAIAIENDDRNLYDETFLQNYASINVLPEIKRVPGVGQAFLFGGRDYAMRIWINPQKLSSYGMSPQDVLSKIQDQSLEAAPGRIGENSSEAFEYTIKYRGKFNKAEEFQNIILRSNPDGTVLTLKDVARVEFGAASYASAGRSNGRYGTSFGILQTAGSNANEIQISIMKLLDRVSKSFPKGVRYRIIYNTKVQLDDSIDQVEKTLLEAFGLVFIVVLVFLGDFRSTLIPAIAVPVSLVGTFFFLQLMGFSINLLTLFALVLSIGIVVDDAIVVVEAVHSKMEHTGMGGREATVATMSEITPAIISITLVMSAVFFPAGFIKGSTGLFYKQFAFTIATAILISAVNALTLSPALCALFLRNPHAPDPDGPKRMSFGRRFSQAFQLSFRSLTQKYRAAVGTLLHRPWIAWTGLALFVAVSVYMMRTTPSAFVPSEDDNFVAVNLTLPPGATLDRTNKEVETMSRILSREPSINTAYSVAGFSAFGFFQGSSYGANFIGLKPRRERGSLSDINQIVAHFQKALSDSITDAEVTVFTFPTLPGFGNFNGLSLALQDHTGGTIKNFSQVTDSFIHALNQNKALGSANTQFRADFPQKELEIDYAKAAQLGVSIQDVMTTISSYFGTVQAADFNRFGKFYRAYMQADVSYRAEPSSLDNIFVKSQTGNMVPLSSVLSLKHVYGPEFVNRYNLFNAITVNATPAPGVSTGSAMKAVEMEAARSLPTGFSFEWTDLSREEKQSGNQMLSIFLLSLLFVYFLLAALYESYLLPLAVLLSVPAGIVGVFAAIRITHMDNNIFVQVGLIMLIGLLAKNAILIVEFALQRRKAGASLQQAALEGATLRLRPILMTSFAFIAGLIPLMYAKGASANGNHSISIGTAGGMLSGVLVGIFIVPVLFVAFQALQEKIVHRHEEKLA